MSTSSIEISNIQLYGAAASNNIDQTPKKQAPSTESPAKMVEISHVIFYKASSVRKIFLKPSFLRTSRKGLQYIKRTALGFFGGVFLSYLIFFAMIMQLNYSLLVATWLGSIVSIVLTLGLAFSERIQCITLLTLPQLFSKRGRSMLIAYVFLIALSGPVANTAKNTEILSASLSCGQVCIGYCKLYCLLTDDMNRDNLNSH